MKYLLLIAGLVAALVAALVLITPRDDNPFAELALPWQVDEHDQRQLPHTPEMEQLHNDQGGARLYRWREPGGGWSYGDRPPPGVTAEPVELGDTQRPAPMAREDE